MASVDTSGPECVYIVEREFLDTWRAWSKGDGVKPLAINNNKLLEADGTLKGDLIPAADYRYVNKKVWDFLIKKYGGGPEVLKWPRTPETDMNANKNPNSSREDHAGSLPDAPSNRSFKIIDWYNAHRYKKM